MIATFIFSLCAIVGVYSIYEYITNFELHDPFSYPIHETRLDLANIESSLILYYSDKGKFPSNEQELEVLTERKIYLRDVPIDYWGKKYRYAAFERGVLIWSEGSKGAYGMTLSKWIKYPNKN